MRERTLEGDSKRFWNERTKIFHPRPVMITHETCRHSTKTSPSASKAIENLIRVGIVQKIARKQRDGIFVFNEYLPILGEVLEQITRSL